MMVFRYSIRFVMIVVCALLASCGNKEEPVQATAPKLMVVNVLSPEAHQDAHIKGSINVPFEKLEETAKNWNKDTRIVVYCANYFCTASAEGARKLQKMGFKNVAAYEGGSAEWIKLGYPIVGPAREGYLSNVGSPHQVPADITAISSEALKQEIDQASKAGTLAAA